MSRTIEVECAVEVDLDDIDIDDIVEYLEDNGYTVEEKESSYDDEEDDNKSRSLFRTDSERVAEMIKGRMLDFDKTFMHNLLCDLLDMPKSSGKEDILSILSNRI